MCGIVGILSNNGGVVDDASLQRMTDALAHRGPDAKNIYLDTSKMVGLGHTRLSIIDLSENANQPFFSFDRRYVIVFNGEIYNFKLIRSQLISLGCVFRTHSDTDVIVQAFAMWGEQMIEKLDGMFAFAIFDQLEKRLTFCRDRMGKKPLFYYQSEDLFVFASEIKSLMKHPRIYKEKKINVKAIHTFLHLGYIPEPDSIYLNIKKFPAGEIGVLEQGKSLSLRPYWKVKEAVGPPSIGDFKSSKKKLELLLVDAIRKRLISDVPVGVFLSGGIDSSLISALAVKQVDSRLKTFCIGFNESKYNELGHARKVANHLKTDHIEFVLAEKDAIDILESYFHRFGEPFADTSSIPTMLVSELARKDVKVALTGDGGDELFLGYGAYTWADRLQSPVWSAISRMMVKLFRDFGNSRWQRVADMLEVEKGDNIRSHIFSQEQYYFSQREIENNLLVDKSLYKPFEYDESFADCGFKESEKQALFDLQYYLKDDLLVKVDRSSMYYGLECRCPFLDRDVVEYALTLDHSLKIRNGERKWILKRLLEDFLPQQLVNRPKWGFSIPLVKWLKEDLHFLIEDYLNDWAITEIGLLNLSVVRDLKDRFHSGKADHLYNRLWLLIVIQKWLKENS